MKPKQCFPLLVIGLILWGCSAPHDNPLDPESDNYHPTVHLQGSVHVIHKSWANLTFDTYLVVPQVSGEDAEAQDTVSVLFGESLSDTLSWNPATEVWYANFAPSHFGDSRPTALVGKPFLFEARNGTSVHTIGPAFVFRVIEAVPQVSSPADDDTANATPTFSWPMFNGGFAFDYVVEVYNDSGLTDWASPRLPSSVLSAQVPQTLRDGWHYWTLTVFDEFENSSRSKEAFFYVDGARQFCNPNPPQPDSEHL